MRGKNVEAVIGKKGRTPHRKTEDAKMSKMAEKSQGRDRMSRSDLLARTQPDMMKKTQTIPLPEYQQRIIGNYMKWLLPGTVPYPWKRMGNQSWNR
jgi:hypothetical protein